MRRQLVPGTMRESCCSGTSFLRCLTNTIRSSSSSLGGKCEVSSSLGGKGCCRSLLPSTVLGTGLTTRRHGRPMRRRARSKATSSSSKARLPSASRTFSSPCMARREGFLKFSASTHSSVIGSMTGSVSNSGRAGSPTRRRASSYAASGSASSRKFSSSITRKVSGSVTSPRSTRKRSSSVLTRVSPSEMRVSGSEGSSSSAVVVSAGSSARTAAASSTAASGTTSAAAAAAGSGLANSAA